MHVLSVPSDLLAPSVASALPDAPMLSALVADRMIGGSHRPNAEVMAQGWANIGSALFGGLLLLGARAGDLLGRRRTFLFGAGLFTLASLLGGFAGAGTVSLS